MLCALAAAAAGVPLAMFITPFLFLLAVVALRLADQVTGLPEPVWTALREFAQITPRFLDAISASPQSSLLPLLREALQATGFPFGSPLLTGALLLAPSMLAVLVVWLGYRALFQSSGVGVTLLALGAREPRLDDAEERQLANVVEEIAIAAGLPPPKVRLLDTAAPNAAAVGSGLDDAVIVVSRGLLERMDRDETQAVIAHVIASVGNGDLHLALSLTTLFQSIELFFTAFAALVNLSSSAWRDLMHLAGCVVRGRSDPRAPAALAALLERRLGDLRDDGVVGWLRHADRLPFLYLLIVPFALFYIPFMLLKFQVLLFRLMIVGPLLTMLWRTRRYLADATAVQLTRNPDALARGLSRLAAEGAIVPGGRWFSHLFVVGSEAALARQQAAFHARLAALRERPAAGTLTAAEAAYLASREHSKDVRRIAVGSWSQELGGVRSHPPLKKRLARLEALGADPLSTERPAPVLHRSSGAARVLQAVLAVVLAPIAAVGIYLLGCVVIGVFLLGVVSATLFTGFAMLAIQALIP